MLTFNDLLCLEGVEPAQVRLVRHQDNRVKAGRLYEAWRNDRSTFERYQSAQKRDMFDVGDLLASFIVTEARKTVFVGLYQVAGIGTCPAGTVDALTRRRPVRPLQSYDLRLLEQLGDYTDKIVIDWGARHSELGPACRQPAQAGPRDRRAVRTPFPRVP